MIKDAGFTIKANQSLEELLEQDERSKNGSESDNQTDLMKDIKDLRPKIQLQSAIH